MNPYLNLVAFATLLLGMAAAPAARAQEYDAAHWGMMLSNTGTTRALAGLAEDRAREAGGAAGSAKATRPTAATAKTSFAYVPTAALQKQTVDNFIAQTKATNPAGAAALAAELKPGKTYYPAFYRTLNQGSGLKENDAADVLAAYLILNWMAVNDVRDGKAITVPMARGVRAQTAGVLAQNAKLRTPAAAAALGEELKLQTTLLQVGWQGGMKNGTAEAFRQKLAVNFQKQYKFDLRQMQLTAAGLTKK